MVTMGSRVGLCLIACYLAVYVTAIESESDHLAPTSSLSQRLRFRSKTFGVPASCRAEATSPNGFSLCVPKCLKGHLSESSPLKSANVPECKAGTSPCQTRYTSGSLDLPKDVEFMPCRDECSGGYGAPAVCHPPELKGSKILKGIKLKPCPQCVTMCLTEKLKTQLVDADLYKSVPKCPHRGEVRSFCIPHAFRLFKWAFKGKSMTVPCADGVTGCMPHGIKKGVKLPKGVDMPACRLAKCKFRKLMPCLHKDYQFMKWPEPLSGFPPCGPCNEMCVPREHVAKFAKLDLPVGLKIKACPDYKEMKKILKKALDPRGRALMKEKQAKNRQNAAMAAQKVRREHKERLKKLDQKAGKPSESDANNREWSKKGRRARRAYWRKEKVMKEASKEKIVKAKKKFKDKYGGLPAGMDKPIETKIKIGVTAVPTCKNCPWFGSVVKPSAKPEENDAALEAQANTGADGKQDKIRAAQAAALLKERKNVETPQEVAKSLAQQTQQANALVLKKAQQILNSNPFGGAANAEERQLNREAYAFYKKLKKGTLGPKTAKPKNNGTTASAKAAPAAGAGAAAGATGHSDSPQSKPVLTPVAGTPTSGGLVAEEKRTIPLPASVQKIEDIISIVNRVGSGVTTGARDQPLSMADQALAQANSKLMSRIGDSHLDFANNPEAARTSQVPTTYSPAHGKPQFRRRVETVNVKVAGKDKDTDDILAK